MVVGPSWYCRHQATKLYGIMKSALNKLSYVIIFFFYRRRHIETRVLYPHRLSLLHVYPPLLVLSGSTRRSFLHCHFLVGS